MDVRDHGFFVFFAPRDNPQIAGVVFVDHGEHGSTAAPIAKHVMETFFAKQDGLPLPPLVPPAAPAPAPPAPAPAQVIAQAPTRPAAAQAPARLAIAERDGRGPQAAGPAQ
jgi:penicillin-binding protein 2